MATHHTGHSHQHGPNCGHTAVQHDGHTDYLHDGHLHHVGAGGVEEHTLAVGGANPAACTPQHACGGHDASAISDTGRGKHAGRSCACGEAGSAEGCEARHGRLELTSQPCSSGLEALSLKARFCM